MIEGFDAGDIDAAIVEVIVDAGHVVVEEMFVGVNGVTTEGGGLGIDVLFDEGEGLLFGLLVTNC